MAEAVGANSQDSVEQSIKDHAQKTFSLAPEKANLQEVKNDLLLSDAREFYVEEKGVSHGKHYKYLFWNNHLYCSGVDEDFGRFLKDFDFLQKKNLNSDWFLNALWKLNNFRDMLPIKSNDINNPSAELKSFSSKIAAPNLVRGSDGGATLTFFTQTVNVIPVQKFVITVAPDYTVNFNRNFVSAAQ